MEGLIQIGTQNRHLDRPIKGYDQVHSGDYIVLSITDNGAGIADEDLNTVIKDII